MWNSLNVENEVFKKIIDNGDVLNQSMSPFSLDTNRDFWK